MSTNTEQHLAH